MENIAITDVQGIELPRFNQKSLFKTVVNNLRQEKRKNVNIRAFAPDGQEYRVIDISKGGLRITAPSLVWPGNQMDLLLNAHREGLVSARAEVLSFVPHENGVAMRLSFINPSNKLSMFLSRLMDTEYPKS